MGVGKGHEQQRRRSQYKDVLLSQPPPGSSEETMNGGSQLRGRKRSLYTSAAGSFGQRWPRQVFNSPAFLGCTWIREALGQEARGSSLR